MSRKIPVDAEALKQILQCLEGPPHLIRELQATRDNPPLLTGNPIDVLIRQFTEEISKPVINPEIDISVERLQNLKANASRLAAEGVDEMTVIDSPKRFAQVADFAIQALINLQSDAT
jgi:hypothetical protein